MEVTKALFDIEALKARLAAVEAERDSLIDQIADAGKKVQALTAERDAAQAGEARAVACLKEIDEYDGGADSVLEDEYVTRRRMEAVEGGASSLDWLAQQRAEAAAAEVERIAGECHNMPGLFALREHLRFRAAALRAGKGGE